MIHRVNMIFKIIKAVRIINSIRINRKIKLLAQRKVTLKKAILKSRICFRCRTLGKAINKSQKIQVMIMTLPNISTKGTNYKESEPMNIPSYAIPMISKELQERIHSINQSNKQQSNHIRLPSLLSFQANTSKHLVLRRVVHFYSLMLASHTLQAY